MITEKRYGQRPGADRYRKAWGHNAKYIIENCKYLIKAFLNKVDYKYSNNSNVLWITSYQA